MNGSLYLPNLPKSIRALAVAAVLITGAAVSARSASAAALVSETIKNPVGVNVNAAGTLTLQAVSVTGSGITFAPASYTITLPTVNVTLATGTWRATYSIRGVGQAVICTWVVPASGTVTVGAIQTCPASTVIPPALPYTGLTGMTAGDLIYGGAAGLASLLPRDTTGMVLTLGPIYPYWAASGASSVTSVFGRTGAVVATTGDYSYSQLSGTVPAVTSVAGSFTGGLISVSGSPFTTSGTLAFTIAGTSGGIPYFSSSSTWASTSALTQYGVVLGGGAGAAPTVVTPSTNTAHVLLATATAPAMGLLTAGHIPNLPASILTSGQLGVTRGGTGADMSATGGTAFVVRQSSAGGVFTASQLAASELSNGVSGSGAVALVAGPTFTTPALGAATATTVNGLAITANGTNTLNIAAGKALNVSNTITFTATDSSTLAIGTGGTLGTNAYTSTAYAPIASPTFTGTVTVPTPFTVGAVSMTATGTQLNYLNTASGVTGTGSVMLSASPVMTGTPTIPATGFTLANHAHIAANSGGALTYAAMNQDRSVLTWAEEWQSGSTTNGFLGYLNWRKGETTVACTISNPASEDGHPGIIRTATSTTNPDSCTLSLLSGMIYGISQKAPWKAQAILRIGSITTGKYYFGMYAATASNRIWIYFDPAESATWRFLTDSAGSVTVGDSTITAAANTWYRMTVEMTTAGTVLFSVDNETPVSRSTNVPGSTISMGVYHMTQNTTAASNTMDIDWTAFQQTGMTR